MTRIVLTEEQAKLLDPTQAIEICDPKGHVVVVIPPVLTADELAKIRRVKDCKGPWIPGWLVQESLHALEEAWQREGPFDIARAREIVREHKASRGH